MNIFLLMAIMWPIGAVVMMAAFHILRWRD